MRFTEDFKKEMVKKLLVPGGKGASELSEEIGVTTQTLYNWRDKLQHELNIDPVQKSPRKWNIKEKYSAILESSNLPEVAYGAWLRKTGLHSEHIEMWKKEIETMVSSPKDKEEIRKLKKQNKNYFVKQTYL